MSALLRAAKPKDASEIVRVLRDSRLRFIPYAPPTHSMADDLLWVSRTLIPSGGVTIATLEGKVIGVLATRDAGASRWIDQLYVDPEHCGQGIGTQLLRSALACLQPPIHLYTFQENHGARHFYERFGFRAVKFGDGSENEEGCPDVQYEYIEGVADDA